MGFLRMLYARKILVFVITLIVIVTIIIFNRENYLEDMDRAYQLQKIHETIVQQNTLVACKQPDLPLNSPEIMKFMKYVPPINCSKSQTDWVVCEGFECKVKDQIREQYGKVKCSFTDVLRVDDVQLTNGETTNTDSFYKLERSDLVNVHCQSDKEKWNSVLTGIRYDAKVWETIGWETVPEDGMKMNVLMLGFDSLSRNTFIRKLPKTYEYMTQVLGTHVLKGYNIVGDGTPQALIPILTGKTELELPDTRKRYANAHYVNVYPFVWNNFKKIGYATAFFEDVPNTGIFTYRLKGFNEQPTDHYIRPYYLAANKYIKKWPKLCSGSIPRHNVLLNQIKSFFKVYEKKPKFLFGFHGELSHDDYNLIGAADDDLLKFLKDLYNGNTLNNTIFIFMSDHGHRFADIRNTMQGKQEERLPFFSFTFPQWFKTKYTRAYQNFVNNLNKLVTPFDLYSTFQSMMHLDKNDEADVAARSLSLFTKIPHERTCTDAYIEPHWCTCLEWTNVSLSDSVVKILDTTLITTLNEYTNDFRNICAKLNTKEIIYVTKLQPNENLIKFKKNADMDGFLADLSGKTKLKTNTYQIKLLLTPGDSLFEASITHNLEKDKFDLKMSDISRINQYGSQARCIEDDLPHLRKYCYCI